MRNVTRIVRSFIGLLVGAVMVAVGVGYVFGLGCSLIVGGAALVTYFLTLYDVDKP